MKLIGKIICAVIGHKRGTKIHPNGEPVSLSNPAPIQAGVVCELQCRRCTATWKPGKRPVRKGWFK